MKEFFIESDGIKLHAKLERPDGVKTGPLCILIHGFTGHMEEDHILAVKDAILEANVSVLRVEMFGHGQSEGDFESHTLYKWVSNALSVVEYARTLDFVTDLYLCGHSQGGLLTMLIGGMCPNDFKAIIPISPAWMIPEDCRKGIVLGSSFDPINIPEKVTSEEGGWWLKGDYIRVAQTIHVEDEINRFKNEVLVIHGDMDEVVPYEYGIKAEKLYNNAKLVPIKNANHCFDDHLEELKEAVRFSLGETVALS